ncbi:MAG: hypothetical protein E7115_03725 [Bacteroidales bacterium]|nr:hypothetical protein [Bacteroidales bacterium]
MYKKLLVLIIALFAGLASADNCRAQYDVLKFGDFGISSITPRGFTSVKGAVWVDVDNPQVGFSVSEIYGKLYKNGVPMIEGQADDYYVPTGNGRLVISGVASLCPGVSIFDVLGLIFFDPEDYTVDIKAIITDDGAEPVVKEVKDIPVLTLLKKDSEE